VKLPDGTVRVSVRVSVCRTAYNSINVSTEECKQTTKQNTYSGSLHFARALTLLKAEINVYLHFVKVHKVEKVLKKLVKCTEIYFCVMYNMSAKDEVPFML
jgi:hypothetical protein